MVFKHSFDTVVFSAHAEVVPSMVGIYKTCVSILRARGGSSHHDYKNRKACGYSPRTRR